MAGQTAEPNCFEETYGYPGGDIGKKKIFFQN